MYSTPEASVDAIQLIESVPMILDVVCQSTGMGFAAIARVTDDRWIACGVHDTIDFGLRPGGELKIETTICNEIREHREPVVIDNVSKDPTYSGHHTPKTLGMFKLFADLIAFHLDAHARLQASQNELASERHDTGLREQFIAVLGHDLRNPLASIDAGTRVLQRATLDDRSKNIVGLIQGSVRRMAGIIDNVLDFARGRMGEGVPIDTLPDVALKPVLAQIVEEMRASNPGRIIEADLADGVATCDPGRIGQLFSNLLSNAVTHGSPDGAVRVTSAFENNCFQIEVANSGEAIAAEMLESLFKPFVRASARSAQQGLGLGLYIASEIAKAHSGTLKATSTGDETRFVFRMATNRSSLPA